MPVPVEARAGCFCRAISTSERSLLLLPLRAPSIKWSIVDRLTNHRLHRRQFSSQSSADIPVPARLVIFNRTSGWQGGRAGISFAILLGLRG